MSSRLEPASLIARLQSIGDDEFEDFVGDVFQDAGWDTEVTQSSKDGGLDVVATKGGVIKQRANIQAKRYSEGNKVGQDEVASYQQLKDKVRWGDVDHAVIVTTSSFTKGGFNIGKELNIKLLDGMGLATLVSNRGLDHLVDEYGVVAEEAPPVDVGEYDRSPREEYYGDFHPEDMSAVFSDVDLIHAIEVMENRRIGKHRIKAIDQLREAVENEPSDPPTELVASEPWILDLNWWDVEIRQDVADKLPTDSASTIMLAATDMEETICVQENGKATVVSLIPPSETISRPELARIESHVDDVVLDGDNDLSEEDVRGYVVGGNVSRDDRTVQKLNRLSMTNFRVNSYQNILRKAVKANRELIQAVRPFAVQEEDETTIGRIRELNRIIESETTDPNIASPKND